MSYEMMPGHGHGRESPRPFLPNSVWSGLSGRQYTSLSSSHEFQGAQATPTPYSGTSDFQYFEQGDPFSSTTHIIDNTLQPNRYSNRPAQEIVGTPWEPGFWRRFPWLGIAGIFGTVIATFACVVILVRSEGLPIQSWKFQPTVYVSIFTAIANITLTLALYEGVVISFWVKAGQGGTLQELHQYWQSGSSVWGAFYGISQLRGKVVGVACIMTVISIGRGPLMQRASSVQNITGSKNGTMNIFSALIIPEGYAGSNTGRTSTPSMMNPNFTEIVQAYTNKDNIVGVWSGCDNQSTCFTNVKGFGFGVACNTTSFAYSIAPILVNSTTGSYSFPQVQSFSADAWQTRTWNPKWNLSSYQDAYYKDNGLLLNATFISDSVGYYNGTITQNLCTLSAGIVSYPVVISNNTITLQNSDWNDDTYLEDVGMLALPYNSVSNIAGYILAAKGLYYGTGYWSFGGGAGYILNLNGASANRYFKRLNQTENYYLVGGGLSWRDPMEDMINSMREIAFRTSLRYAYDNTSYANASQHVPYRSEFPVTVYTTNYGYMAGAVVISLLGVLAVLPTYRGFWELGRPVSLSPLEIAKAFNAPLLSATQGNRSAEEMLRELGWQKVRYGDSGQIVGQATVSGVYGREAVVRRLGIGVLSETPPPEKGGRYA